MSLVGKLIPLHSNKKGVILPLRCQVARSATKPALFIAVDAALSSRSCEFIIPRHYVRYSQTDMILATAASATTIMVVWMLPVGRSGWIEPSTMYCKKLAEISDACEGVLTKLSVP
jgi:hypothetical protein